MKSLLEHQIRRWIGISTHAVKNLSLDEAIDAARKRAFGTLEINPHLYGGPGYFSQASRGDLKKKLSCFDMVTVHPSAATFRDGRRLKYYSPEGRRGNIASLDAEFRRSSVEEYLAYVRFALDAGASLIAFHPGRTGQEGSSGEEREANAAFAQAALGEAQGSGLRFAYETFDLALIEEIDSPRFGVLFDIGHACEQVAGDLTLGVIELMGKLFAHIFQFHVHGVHVSPDGRLRPHLPLQANNAIEYSRVLRAIRVAGLPGPLIFEIGTKGDQDMAANLKSAEHAREEVLAMWAT